MSNLSTLPGSGSLEQLKVAELRDELRKRGMSLKGVKKELFERLEEAVKKEELDGIIDGQHGVALEGAHKTTFSDGTEDFEEEDEALDENKIKVSSFNNTMNAHATGNVPSSCSNNLLPSLSPSSVLLKVPLSTTLVSETHASSGVSAPDGVPGFNEDREHLCAASAAIVVTNNDVLFVDNAVSQNGDGMLLPPSIADTLEPGKGTSGNQETGPESATSGPNVSENAYEAPESGLVVSLEPSKGTIGNQETGPEIATSGPNASENADEAPESGLVVSNGIGASIENSNAHVAADVVVSANDAIITGCALHDVEKEIFSAGSKDITEQLSKSEILIESSPTEEALMRDSGLSVGNSHQEKESGNLKTEILSVPLADSTYEDLGESVADERDIIADQAKPNTKMESMETDSGVEEKHELVIAGEMGKSDVKMEPMVVDANEEDKHKLISRGNKEVHIDVKMEPMEVDAGTEDAHKLIKDCNKEVQNDKENAFQPQSPLKGLQEKEAKLQNSSCMWGSRNEESRVQDKRKRTATDSTHLKSTQDNSQVCANLRQKDHDTDSKQQEPAKRMRRWNSGKEASGDALKPLTADTVKEVILPKSMENSLTLRELALKVKVEPGSVNTPIVPPSTRAPSNSLKIERFVRPFTLKAVKDLLAEFGQCVDFWMDQIKTHCFVSYPSVSEAVAARNGLYGRQWPPSVGNFLVAEFVDTNEVKMRSEGAAEKAQPTAPLQIANLPPPPPRVATSFRSGLTTLPPPRFSRERQLPAIPQKDPEPAGLTLEDLFFKTKAKPSVYYLPLTDEQVAEKLAAAKKINKTR